MRRRRSAALRDAAGAHHVASRLSHEGFRAAVGPGAGSVNEVLAGLPGGSGHVAVAVKTAECPDGFGDGSEGVACEWRVGGELALAGDPGPFVALVDLGRAGRSPRVWVVPSREVRDSLAPAEEGRPYRYRASAEELAPLEENWDAVEGHLLAGRSSRTAWFDREELEEVYSEEFVEALDTEAMRLLDVQNSVTRRMADGRFPAEDLADARALLSVLFRRHMQEQRDRREEEYRRRKREGRR